MTSPATYSRIVCCLLFVLLATLPARAELIQVTHDLSGLNGLGTFYLNYQLTDGSGVGNQTTRVDIYNTVLTGGFFGTNLDPTIGHVYGTLSNRLILLDGTGGAEPVADYAIGIQITQPVASLTYVLEVKTTAVDSPVPDYFSMAILDPTVNFIETNGPASVEFLAMPFENLEGNPLLTFGSNNPAYPLPTAQLSAVSAPETASVAFVLPLLGIGSLVLRKHTARL